MSNSKKLLYILPEMAFTASLQKSPKDGYFLVQAFHQINGEFLADENFLFENLKKLFEKIEPDEYTLVLPDFLFTDTIVSVPATQDLEIARYLRDELLPKIEVSTFSHETRTSVLLQRGKTSKVQLSAWEKELAAELKLAIGSHAVKITEIVPLSWTLKAAVSLEPSITIAQLGERLYLAEHFVGINQTINAKITEVQVIGETVRTLKGADPNLQTAYLFTSALVEEKIKKELEKVLPVQQLTENVDGDAQIPPYVKQIVEVAGRTLSLDEFVVPRFTSLVTADVQAAKMVHESELEKKEYTPMVVKETKVKEVEEKVESVGGKVTVAAGAAVVGTTVAATAAAAGISAEQKQVYDTILSQLGELKQAETERRLKEAEKEELVRLEEEKARFEEERQLEKERLAAERRQMEEERLAEVARLEEEKRLAEEALLAEKTRLEEARLAEAARLEEEKQAMAEMVIAERRQREEEKLAEEAAKQREIEEQKKAEDERFAKVRAAKAAMEKNQDEQTSILNDDSEGDFLSIFSEVRQTKAPEKAPLETKKPEIEAPVTVAAMAVEKPEEKVLNVGYNNADRAVLNREQKEKDVLSLEQQAKKKAALAVAPRALMAKKEEEAVSEKKGDEKKPRAARAEQKKGGMKEFFRKLLLFLLIFVITIALGIGIGLIILKVSGKDFFNNEVLPTPEPTVLPAPVEATPVEASDSSQEAVDAETPADEEEEELDVSDLDVLVVNATGVAGYAGETKTTLEKEGFTGVKTGNSKGTYDDAGVYVLMKEKDTAIIKALEEATGFTLIFDEDYQTEDANGTYDAVIVLNDKTE